MGEAQPLETIWEIPDDLWEKVEPVLLEGNPPKATYTQAGDSIDEILVSEGLANAWTRDGQHRDLLVGSERGFAVSGC